MTPEFFAALPSPSTQQEVLERLIDLLLETQRSKVVAMVKDIIFKVRNLFQSLTQFSVQCSTSWASWDWEWGGLYLPEFLSLMIHFKLGRSWK